MSVVRTLWVGFLRLRRRSGYFGGPTVPSKNSESPPVFRLQKYSYPVSNLYVRPDKCLHTLLEIQPPLLCPSVGFWT